MALLPQAVAGGLVTGAVYALIALSLVIVYKSTDVVNFAGGDILMTSCYLALVLLLDAGAPYWVAALAAILCAFGIGAAFDRLVLERIARQTRDQDIMVTMVIATIGLSYVLKGCVRALPHASEVQSLPAQFQGPPLFLGDVILLRQDLGIIGTAILASLALFLFFRFTRIGRGLRATAEDPRAAALIGIPVRRMRTLVWGIASGVAALGGLLIAPKILMTPEMGGIVVLGLAASILGGFTSIAGVVAGALLLGVVENLVGLLVSTEAIAVAPFLAIMAVLVLRPQGLFGGSRVASKKV